MLRIRTFLWDRDNIEHISKHAISPEEVEEVCYSSDKFVTKTKEDRIAIRGQTSSGRYVLVILFSYGGGVYRPITARNLTKQEKGRFLRKRKK